MTYGDYQEAASQALVALLDGPPTCRSETPLLLAARGQLIATLQERIDHLGRGLLPDLVVRRLATHSSVARQPLLHLGILATELERSASNPEMAPSDVLRSTDPASRGAAGYWRTAARNSFLATTELQRAERKPWLFESAVRWPLISDLADSVEAVWLLEGRLAKEGMLHGRSRNTYVARVLLAGDIGRLARLAAGNEVADLATAGWGACTSTQGPSIALVHSAADLACAQRRLRDLIRPIRRSNEPGLVEDRPGLRAARVIATGQAAKGLKFADWADEAERCDLASAFRGRVDLYRDLHSATMHLVDIVPRRSPLPTLQQSEMSTMLRAMRPVRLSEQQLEELNRVSQAVTIALGKSLRREGVTARHIQKLVADEAGVRRPEPILSTRHPFHAACKALADVEVPPDVMPPTSKRVARGQLRRALEASTLIATRRSSSGTSISQAL